ncbi:hypothetical protein QBC41DRAFT_224194 [Cercophora samala]|uniref:Uncharacterized protein n=1 Tax=Cercophora samala TaxID=330535 RepID=A0AA39ZE33_9PEZI|nr:hypothetical protein QBC41DRAFT_224194 [Cercophora samala]
MIGDPRDKDQSVTTDEPKTCHPKFKPMDAVNQARVLREEDREIRRLLGYSESYRGNVYNPKNQQHVIPDNENVSLFLTKLPRVYDEKKLVRALMPHGPFDRIYATSVTPPGEGHNGSSAKIVLFTRSGAESLHKFISSGKLVVDNRRVHCVWNKIKHAAPGGPNYLSRVVHVSAAPEILDLQKLIKLLDENIVYQLEGTDNTLVTGSRGMNRIEVRFCSFRAQAEVLPLLLSSEVPQAKVRFGVDPLSVNTKAEELSVDVKMDDKWARLGQFRRGYI